MQLSHRTTVVYIIDIMYVYMAIRNHVMAAVHKAYHSKGIHITNEAVLLDFENKVVTSAIKNIVKNDTSLDSIGGLDYETYVECKDSVVIIENILSSQLNIPLSVPHTTNDLFIQTVLTRNSLYIYLHY